MYKAPQAPRVHPTPDGLPYRCYSRYFPRPCPDFLDRPVPAPAGARPDGPGLGGSVRPGTGADNNPRQTAFIFGLSCIALPSQAQYAQSFSDQEV